MRSVAVGGSCVRRTGYIREHVDGPRVKASEREHWAGAVAWVAAGDGVSQCPIHCDRTSRPACWPVTRPSYVKRSEVEDRTATRDLARLVELGLLQPHGQTRARYYTAGDVLREHMQRLRDQRVALKDPYPGLISEITADATQAGFR